MFVCSFVFVCFCFVLPCTFCFLFFLVPFCFILSWTFLFCFLVPFLFCFLCLLCVTFLFVFFFISITFRLHFGDMQRLMSTLRNPTEVRIAAFIPCTGVRCVRRLFSGVFGVTGILHWYLRSALFVHARQQKKTNGGITSATTVVCTSCFLCFIGSKAFWYLSCGPAICSA